MDTVTQVKILYEVVYILLSTDTLEKDKNPTILSLTMNE